MSNTCDIVLSIAILGPENSFLKQTLVQSLIQMGMNKQCTIIPSVFVPESNLELKGILSICSKNWVDSIVSMLSIKDGNANPTPIKDLVNEDIINSYVVSKLPISKSEMNVDVIMNDLRESLKVSKKFSFVLSNVDRFKIVLKFINSASWCKGDYKFRSFISNNG